jgi:hypothetical protein
MIIEDHLKKEAQQKLQNEYVKKLARDIEIEITLDELKDVNPDGMFP